MVQGTAAVGAALGGASVAMTDITGTPVCTESSIVTTGLGTYQCTLQAGKSAPFVVVVTDPSGAYPPLVSIGTATPIAGTPLTLIATPLTTAIVGQLSSDHDALAVAATPALVDTAALASIRENVLAQLADVLASIGVAAGYDPFTTPIVAATATVSGDTADRVVDVLKITNVNGVTTIATVDNPAAAVVLAGAASASAPKVAAPSAGVSTLVDAVKSISTRLNECFALPPAQRVLAKDESIAAAQGGPEATSLASQCQDIARAGYLNSGYRFGQSLYALLLDADMQGAQFRVPEITRFIDDASAADNDRAVVNIRYADRNGNAGNVITIAQKFPGSATTGHPGDWWLWGNQRPVDSFIRAFIRRGDQLAPNPGTGVFVNAANSRFESGLDIFVNKDGPNSTGLRAARVTGPGLPPAGIVLTRPAASICTDQSWLNIARKDGNTDPAVALPAADVGNLFRLQRTQGVAGADAAAIRPNPNAGNTNNAAFVNWAHPLDYGQAAGSTGYIDFAALPAGATYRFEFFYDGETTPRHSADTSILTPVVPATRGANLQWIGLTAATKAYLDPADPLAAATASIALAWQPNPFAETIASAGVYTYDANGSVNQGRVGVVRGSTSAVANAPGAAAACAAGTTFPALRGDGTAGRQFQLRYRSLDGSFKDSVTRFN